MPGFGLDRGVSGAWARSEASLPREASFTEKKLAVLSALSESMPFSIEEIDQISEGTPFKAQVVKFLWEVQNERKKLQKFFPEYDPATFDYLVKIKVKILQEIQVNRDAQLVHLARNFADILTLFRQRITVKSSGEAPDEVPSDLEVKRKKMFVLVSSAYETVGLFFTCAKGYPNFYKEIVFSQIVAFFNSTIHALDKVFGSEADVEKILEKILHDQELYNEMADLLGGFTKNGFVKKVDVELSKICPGKIESLLTIEDQLVKKQPVDVVNEKEHAPKLATLSVKESSLPPPPPVSRNLAWGVGALSVATGIAAGLAVQQGVANSLAQDEAWLLRRSNDRLYDALKKTKKGEANLDSENKILEIASKEVDSFLRKKFFEVAASDVIHRPDSGRVNKKIAQMKKALSNLNQPFGNVVIINPDNGNLMIFNQENFNGIIQGWWFADTLSFRYRKHKKTK